LGGSIGTGRRSIATRPHGLGNRVRVLHAGAQLAEAKRYSEIIANQAQATLLLNLVDKWNSEEMLASRRLFRARHSEIKQSINDQHRSLNDQQCTTKVNESFNALLGNLYDNDLVGDYLILMRMMGFFETVGLLVRKGYISIDDIDGLFRGPILQSVAAFELHIEIRQKDKGHSARLMRKRPFPLSRDRKDFALNDRDVSCPLHSDLLAFSTSERLRRAERFSARSYGTFSFFPQLVGDESPSIKIRCF
jgi:hypothetical protein